MFRSKKYLGGMVKEGAQVSGLDNWIDTASSLGEGSGGINEVQGKPGERLSWAPREQGVPRKRNTRY